jgi:hypothetical protein
VRSADDFKLELRYQARAGPPQTKARPGSISPGAESTGYPGNPAECMASVAALAVS